MGGEIILDETPGENPSEEEGSPLRTLEGKIGYLLERYQELKRERDELNVSLDIEKEKVARLEKKLELLSQDREKVKTRLDQLLLRLKSVDI
ncbi:MAG: cell division protein ZapB [Thermodesulfobacteriota bacterium]